MVIVHDRHKNDFARVCRTCKGYRCVSLECAQPGDDDRLLAIATKLWGLKATKLFEGTADHLIDVKTGKPAKAFRVDCPTCDGSGFEMYIPKNDLKIEERN